MDVGVGLWSMQSTAAAPRSFARAYRELREDAQLVERLGFRDLWLSEHHFFYDGYCPALLPAAASALAVTSRLHVGTGVLLLPLQDAGRVAAMAGALSARAAGRLELGVGLGYRDVEFDGKGVPRGERVPRLVDGLDRLGADAPAVPVWVGSTIPEGVGRAGARGLGVLLPDSLSMPQVAELASAHRRSWEAAERAGNRPRVAALRTVWVAEDAAGRVAAERCVRATAVRYAGLRWPVEGEPAFSAEQQVERAVAEAVVGPAGEVCEALLALREAGVDHVVLRSVLEGAPRGAVSAMLARVADRVLPELPS